jgi:hypothetical protein
VTNNINQPAFIYQNESVQQNNNHYLSVSLKGANKNTQGIGTKVIIYSAGKKQYLEQMPTRGYESTVSAVLHFGLGDSKQLDSLRVTWQSGNTQLLKSVKGNQLITLSEKDAAMRLISSPKTL